MGQLLLGLTVRHPSLDTAAHYEEMKKMKDEEKTRIKMHMYRIWQEYWDINDTGRHFYFTQKWVEKNTLQGKKW